MTLCIAALCRDDEKEPCVAASFDRRVETVFAGADIEVKLQWLSSSWCGLLAGDVALAKELLTDYAALFDREDQFDRFKLLAELRKPVNRFREDLADRLVRSRLSISLSDLKNHGRTSLPDDVFRQMWYDISSQDLGVELILFGWQRATNSFRLLKLTRHGDLNIEEPFAVIGSGTAIAAPALFQRKYDNFWTLPRALYAVYEAQCLGSIAPGVGHDPKRAYTVGFTYDKEKPKITMLYPTNDTQDWLQEQFKALGPHPVPKNLKLPEKDFAQ